MTEVKIVHTTHYKYDRQVQLGPHLLRLKPSQNIHSEIFNYKMDISPECFHSKEQVGIYGNRITRLVFLEKLNHLKIKVSFNAQLIPFNPFDFLIELHAENFPFKYEQKQAENLSPYLRIFDGEVIEKWKISQGLPRNGKTLDFIIAMNKLVFAQFGFFTREEHGVQTPSETLKVRSGSCRDFSWFLINVFRSNGIAARFVSGYHVDINFDDESKDQLAFHAWVEVFIPGAGWLGLDPTSGLLVNEFYISLCSVPHYADAAPVVGNSEKSNVSLTFSSEVKRY